MANFSKQADHLIKRITNEQSDDSEQMVAILYKELRSAANRLLQQQAPDHTLQATELVNELFVKILGSETVDWNDKYHFFSSAVIAMRRILISHARKKTADKRIPKQAQVPFDVATLSDNIQYDENLIKIDEVLQELEQIDEIQAKIVEFKFFAGLSEIEIADLMQISRSSVQREWKLAKLWLMSEVYS